MHDNTSVTDLVGKHMFIQQTCPAHRDTQVWWKWVNG